MKTVKNFIKKAWDNYCEVMALAYFPYYMKH